MPIVEWDSSLSVGIAEIDQQHKKMIDIINDLYDAMTANRGNEVLGDILNRIIEYAQFHFATEEKYFDQFDYEESDIHKAQHQEYIQKAQEFSSRYAAGKSLSSQEVMNFVRGWLVAHINRSDKKYTKCFNDHGLY